MSNFLLFFATRRCNISVYGFTLFNIVTKPVFVLLCKFENKSSDEVTLINKYQNCINSFVRLDSAVVANIMFLYLIRLILSNHRKQLRSYCEDSIPSARR